MEPGHLSAPVDPNSANYINFIGSTTPLHPDFGAGLYNNSTIGIPYVVVSGSTFVNIAYTAYGDESDPAPCRSPRPHPSRDIPIPATETVTSSFLIATTAGFTNSTSYLQANGSWKAASGAVWDFLNDEQRPYTWTSADAAGLPIFPGLARYDGVASGAIHHALRYTLQYSQTA